MVAPVAILAPFLGGWLADKAGFSMTFITSAVASLATVIVLQFFMRDPRHERQKESGYNIS
jgi:predicted MFS family arabinose efflux permease